MPNFSFGTLSPIVPSGKTTSPAFGTAPLVVPSGKAVTTALSSVPLTVPTGQAFAPAFGTSPLFVPTGKAFAPAFGAQNLTTITYVGFTKNFDNNTAITVTTPTGTAAGDLILLLIFFSSPAGTVQTPSGWHLYHSNSNADSSSYVFGRFYQSGDSDPVVTPSGGSAGDGLLGAALTFRHASAPAFFGSDGVNVSAEDIAVPATTTTAKRGAVIVFGGRNAGFTAAPALTGDGLTWVNAAENSQGAIGAYLDVQYAIFGNNPTLTNKVIDITGGPATSLSVMFIVPDIMGEPMNLYPDGLAVTASFGFVAGITPSAVPAGFAVAASFGTLPIVAPGGQVASTGLGGVPVVVPAGLSSATAAGNAPPIIAPQGFATATAFGTPTNTVALVATGKAVTAAFGGVAIVIPSGSACAVGIGSPTAKIPPRLTPGGLALTTAYGGVPFAAPRGTAVNSAFGATALSLSVATGAPTPSQLAGRGWAAGRFGWDAILARWEQLQLDERKAEIELAEVQQELRQAPRVDQAELERQQADLDERLDELRWQMQLMRAEAAIHEREMKAEAAKRALLDDDEAAIMLLL